MELLPLVCLCLLSCSGDAVRVLVEQDSDAVLPCSPNPKVDISGQVFDWKKDGQKEVFFYDSGIHSNNGHSGQDKQFWERVSHFQDQLKNGDASIKIQNTKMADSGTYSCIFPRLQSQTSIIELVVGAAPKPYIFILDGTTYWSLLQCEAHGTPLPTLEWQDSANKTLHAEESQVSVRKGRTYVTLNITVTKTGRYRCVATQKTLSHQISTVIPLSLQGAAPEPGSNTGAIVGGVVSLLSVVAVVVVVLYFKRRIKQIRLECEKNKGEKTDPEAKQLNHGSTPVAANGQAEGGQCDLDTL